MSIKDARITCFILAGVMFLGTVQFLAIRNTLLTDYKLAESDKKKRLKKYLRSMNVLIIIGCILILYFIVLGIIAAWL